MKKSKTLLRTIILFLVALPLAGAFAQVPETVHFQGRVTVDDEPFNGTGQFKFAIVDGGTENVGTATATATVTSGFVTSIAVTDPGNGYLAAPFVKISGGGGSEATATAVLENGRVVQIDVDRAGSGYTTAPDVTISPPPPATIQTLWSSDGSSSGGDEPGASLSLAVSGGVFSVFLGDTALAGMDALPVATFDSSPVFLRIWFNDGATGFRQLAPDQAFTAVPYALKAAAVADGAIGSAQIDSSIGIWSSIGGKISATENVGIGVTDPQASLHIHGSAITGFASNVASGMNSFVSGGGTFSGTPFINTASGEASFVGGGIENMASGIFSFVGGGSTNTASGLQSFVAGGSENTADGHLSFVGGGVNNRASGSASFVAGSQSSDATGTGSFVGGGFENAASGLYAFVGGGSSNTASGIMSFAAGRRAKAEHDGTFVWADNTNADFATTAANQFLIRAGGGVGIGVTDPQASLQVLGNTITGHTSNVASGENSFVSGGTTTSGTPYINTASGEASFVGGGNDNTASGTNSFVGGGIGNTASGFRSFVAGGAENTASGNYSFVGGGVSNTASGVAFVGGGVSNSASGTNSFVGGGFFNTASGRDSFAAGRRAKAEHDGTFVWADNTNANFATTAANQFLIRAGGGVGIGVTNPQAALHVDGNAVVGGSAAQGHRLGVGTSGPWTTLHVVSPEGQDPLRVTVGNNNSASTALRAYGHGGVAIGNSWTDTGVPERGLRVFGDAIKPGGGSWSSPSDERLKRNIEPIEPGILDRLLALNGYTFEFEDEAVENDLARPGMQIGLIAQEVAEVFPDWVDENGNGYLYVTERGTTALMVEALRELRAEKAAAVSELQKENRLLREKSAEIETRLARIEALLAGNELAAK